MCNKNVKVCLVTFIYISLLVKCGRVKRVIGAAEVECDVQPNVASLRNSSSLEHKCGATIISPHFAITAAHCVQTSEDEYFLQLNNFCTKDNGVQPKVTIKKIIRHEAYNPITRAHDVALLRLTFLNDMTWLQRTLPRSSFGISGECVIYGYGYQDLVTMETSERLLAGTLTIISLDECERSLGPYVAPRNMDGMMCAVGDGIDACQGDSGSPLICAGLIEGISSYGMSCAVPGIPGVYASVGAHLNWIRDVIRDDEWS